MTVREEHRYYFGWQRRGRDAEQAPQRLKDGQERVKRAGAPMNGRAPGTNPQRLKDGWDGTCPVCRRVYVVTFVYRAWGAERLIRRHKQGGEYCLGSRQIRVEDQPND